MRYLFQKKIIILLLFLGFFSPYTLLHGEEQVEESEYIGKVGIVAPEGSSFVVQLRKAFNYVYENSQRKIKFIFYTGGIMGDEPDMARKLKLGQLQYAGFTVRGLYNIVPEMLIMDLPFLFNSYDEVDYIREKMWGTFSEIFKKRGFVMVSWLDLGFIQFYTKEPVITTEDLAEQKLWVWTGEPIAMETTKAIGVSPIMTPVPEVLTSLQTGIINAVQTAYLPCVAFQWFLYINYILEINIRYETTVVVVQKDFYDSLPKDLQELSNEVSEKFTDETIQKFRADNREALAGMIEHGIKVNKLTPEEKDEYRKKAVVVWDQFADKLYPRWLLDELLGHLNDYRSKNSQS